MPLTKNTKPCEIWKIIDESMNESPVFKVFQVLGHGSFMEKDLNPYGTYSVKTFCEILDELLKNAHDVEIPNSDGDTALMVAAALGCTELLKALLRKSDTRNINARNKEGYTALMMAVNFSRFESVEILISKGAEINSHNRESETAVTLACEKAIVLLDTGRPKFDPNAILTALIAAGGQNFTEEYSTLSAAVISQNITAVKIILDKYPQLLNKSFDGLAPEWQGNVWTQYVYLLKKYLDADATNSIKKFESYETFSNELIKLYRDQIDSGIINSADAKYFYESYLIYTRVKTEVMIKKATLERDFVKHLEGLQSNTIHDQDLTFSNQFNLNTMFITAMQRNTSVRLLKVDYDNAISDLIKICRDNTSIEAIYIQSSCAIIPGEMEHLVQQLNRSEVTALSISTNITAVELTFVFRISKLQKLYVHRSSIHWTSSLNGSFLENMALKELEIQISSGMVDFLKAVSQHRSLEKLILSIDPNRYTAKENKGALEALLILISSNTALKVLDLSFKLDNIEPHHTLAQCLVSIEKIAKALRNNHVLEEIRLYQEFAIQKKLKAQDKLQNHPNLSLFDRFSATICKGLNTIFRDNLTLKEIILQQPQFLTYSDLPNDSEYRMMLEKMRGFLIRNQRLHELASCLYYFKPVDNEQAKIEKLYELAKNSYIAVKNVWFVLARMLIKEYPRNVQYAYTALERGCNPPFTYDYCRTQIILSLKAEDTIPEIYRKILSEEQLELLQEMQNHRWVAVSLDEDDKHSKSMEALEHLLLAQNHIGACGSVSDSGNGAQGQEAGLMSDQKPKCGKHTEFAHLLLSAIRENIQRLTLPIISAVEPKLELHNMDSNPETILTLLKMVRMQQKSIAALTEQQRKQEISLREQGTGLEEQELSLCEQGTGSKEKETGSKEQETGSKEQETASKEQRTSSKEQGKKRVPEESTESFELTNRGKANNKRARI